MTAAPGVGGVGFRSERGPILIALMLSTALVAIDSTIIATAVPSIVKDLGGFAQFPWLFSIYLLAQAVAVPIYGKLADMYGRKPIMLIGIGLFLVGSILCGFAWNMGSLIAFRLLQGLGAGAVLPMSVTIAGDIYTVKERAKAQGYIASVWAISSVVGPTLGGVFSDFISWRWIFFVNIPLCLLAGLLVWLNFRERFERTKQRIDYTGAILLTGGSTLLLLGLLEGGQAWAWNSPLGFGVFALSLAMLVAFVFVERRASHPILPLWIFKRRVIVASSITSAGVGAIMLGLSSYVPTFAQQVLGTSALVAGFALAALTIGWPIAAAQSGRLYLRIGFRATGMIGTGLVVVGTGLMLLIGAQSAVWLVALFCFVIGAGMGLVATPTLIAAQSSVGWGERGVVTATNLFARSIGSAVGVAVLGAIVNANLGENAGNPSPAQLTAAVHLVFIALAVVAVGALIAVSFMPRGVPESAPEPATEADPATV
ncbi:MDR family MFS transporter [Plantibacter sp. YIM 135249]|uniref:MDR family MFS transporter n=1 Tax=Plantibacter sp. YIM 135249 TaxID=3423918 RepID=UPI003D35345B